MRARDWLSSGTRPEDHESSFFLSELCDDGKSMSVMSWLYPPRSWVLVWSTVLGLVVQVLAARTGIVGGHQLARLCRHEYKPWASMSIFIAMEIAIITSDLQEVVGSAIAFRILFGLPIWAGVLLVR